MENLTPLQQNRLQTLLDRTSKEWSKIAQEPIKVEVLDDTCLITRCNELAAYRILFSYLNNGKITTDIKASYSKNLNSWVVMFEIEIRKYI